MDIAQPSARQPQVTRSPRTTVTFAGQGEAVPTMRRHAPRAPRARIVTCIVLEGAGAPLEHKLLILPTGRADQA